ncbi:hypothetical protein D3C74_360250 [compost metagenome]
MSKVAVYNGYLLAILDKGYCKVRQNCGFAFPAFCGGKQEHLSSTALQQPKLPDVSAQRAEGFRDMRGRIYVCDQTFIQP